MKGTKIELTDAIIELAINCNKKYAYIALFESGLDMPSMCKMIIVDMFISNFNSYSTTDELYKCYNLVHTYMVELSERGEVIFN